MSWKHGPKTQQGWSFAQYPMLGRHGSIRTRAAISWSRWWMRCLSTKQLMKLKSGYSTTIRRCIPVLDESKFSKAMLMVRIPHFKCSFRFKSPWGNFILLVGVFWGQVDGGEVPIWTPRRRTGWQFWLVNVQHAPVVRPWENLHLSDRQFDPRRQVGGHDEIRRQVREGLRSTK